MPDVFATVTNSATINVTITGGGGGGGGVGSGTVTSVGLSLPNLFTVSGSPVTTAGTLTGTLATQTENTILAGPTTGSAAAPAFRALVAGDIPTLAQSQITNLVADLAGKQPLDADLTAIAGLSPSNDDFLQRKAGAWTNRTVAQVKTDLGLSGTNSGDQTITLTGDVTGSGTGSFAATIGAGAVTFAKMQAVSANVLLGNDATGTTVEEITCTAAGRALLDDADAAAQRTTLGLGTLATQSGTFSGTSSGTNTGDQTITLTGDVTGSGTGSFAATIANDAVTYAKIQNVTASRLLGRYTGTNGDPQEITIGSGLALDSGTGVLSATGGGGGGGEANTASNVGAGGVGVFKQKSGVDLQFKNINAGSNKVTITDDTTNSEVDIDVVPANFTGIPQSGVTNLVTDLAAKAANGANTDITSVYLNNTGLKIKDTNASHGLTIAPGSNITADRTLTITTGDADRTLTLNGNTTLSGTNTGDQTITLTGDVTGSGTGSFAATIAASAVTYAKIQNVSATDRLLGRSTAGAGVVEEITCTAAGRAILDDADAAAQRTTLGLGTLATQNGTFSGTSSGTNTGDQTITLTGDVTGSGTGSFAATIATNAVTDAKFRQSAGLSVVGRSASATGNVADITAANDGEVLRRSGTAIGFGTIATAGLANSAVTYAKIQNVSATDRLLGRSTAGAGVVEEITCTAAGRALLDDADASAQRTTLGLGTLATQNGTFSGTSSGTNTGDQTITLTGDVTGSGTGSFAATIATNAVTDAKFRQSAGLSVVGRSANSPGNVADITGTDGQVLRVSGTTLGFGTIATAGIADDAVTYAKIQNVTQARLLGRYTASTGDAQEISLGSGLSLDSSTGVLSAPASGATDLAFSGASSPVTLTSSTGNDVTITAGTNVTLSATSSNLTINATGGGSSPSVISPSQITADQDDYAPTGWDDATLVRLNIDTGGRAITSFSAASDGEEKTLVNTTDEFAYLPSEHPDGTAANRIAGEQDHILEPYGSIRLGYDNTTARWRVLANTFNAATLGLTGKGLFYSMMPGSTNQSDHPWLGLAQVGTGASNQNDASTTSLPAAWGLTSGTTTTGASSIYLIKNSVTTTAFGSGHLCAWAWLYVPTLSDGTQTYTAQFSLTASASGTTLAVNNSVGVRYSNGTNSGKWQAFTRANGGTESTADSSITVAANTLYMVRMWVDKARSEARFSITDGTNTYVGRIAANLPSAVVCGVRAIIVKSAGTTSRTLNIANIGHYAIY